MNTSNEETNLAHHGSPIFTTRDLHISECVVRWIQIAREYGGIGYGDAWWPSRVDFEKSRLFWRLRSGKDPLPAPPPTCFSCPWYEVVEEPSPHWVMEGAAVSLAAFSKVNDDRPRFAFGQCLYVIESEDDAGQPETVSFGPWKFRCWQGTHPSNETFTGWYLQRIEG